ncbi:AEC family transporter [Methylobacterium radiodurans]|uniref:Transporter n=1 Tax=Methylobacterium radiodurans TaxID=2202828 RepID=A0A2U8VUM0_9HYPH|nr:AEC family transporter [Methylobacterium radiodurans]AWN37405.1 transporter [Methylobacterium radiodurans]
MLTTLGVVLPIFALILAGWLARRTGLLGPHAVAELNRFVVWLALPALLFDVMARSVGPEIWQPGFLATFGLSSGALLGLTAWLARRRGRPLADAAIDGLNASYPNTGYMGFPLALAAFGPAALGPTTIAVILTVCVVFAGAIVLIEAGLQARGGAEASAEASARRGPVALTVALALVRNPLLVAPFCGALVPLLGFGVPAPVEAFLKLLGGAASPCALVALGLFLAERRGVGPSPGPDQRADRRATARLAGLKLVAHPLLAYGLGRFVFDLPPLALHTAVLMAALPTGTGPFMLAEFYRREAALTADTVLVSTVLSVVTVSAYLALVAG